MVVFFLSKKRRKNNIQNHFEEEINLVQQNSVNMVYIAENSRRPTLMHSFIVMLISIYVTDRFAIWTVLKWADGFKMGQPALKRAGLF